MWRVFVPKTDVVTGGWSNLCMNRCINCNIYQMLINVWNQGRQTSYSVGIGGKSQEMKRPGREAEHSHLVLSLTVPCAFLVCVAPHFISSQQ